MDEEIVMIARGMYAMMVVRVLLYMGNEVIMSNDTIDKFHLQMHLWDFAERN